MRDVYSNARALCISRSDLGDHRRAFSSHRLLESQSCACPAGCCASAKTPPVRAHGRSGLGGLGERDSPLQPSTPVVVAEAIVLHAAYDDTGGDTDLSRESVDIVQAA